MSSERIVEVHELRDPDNALETKVEIGQEGDVWVTIGAEILSVEALGKIVAFVEEHGKVSVIPA